MLSIKLKHQLGDAHSFLSDSINRMSTGYKINSAKDDSAGFAICSKQSSELSSLAMASENIQMGQSMIKIASNGLELLIFKLQRIRDLTEQASNGTYSDIDRKAMQLEVDALTDELYRTKNAINFNDVNLLESKSEKSSIITEDEAKAQGYTVVKTAQELKDALKSNDANCKVMLFADIDLDDLGVVDGNNWTAVSNFRGTFDGNGFTISNLKINKPTENNQGLFGNVKDAEIKNINLENVNIIGNEDVGGIAGQITNSSITNSSCRGIINGNYETGGITGVSWNSIIKDSYFSGTVTGETNYTGGLVGFNRTNSIVDNCYTAGKVVGKQSRTGGITGHNYDSAVISNSYSVSEIIGSGATGGIAGINSNKDNSDYSTKSIIENCWAGGEVTGTDSSVGGLVGSNSYSDVINSSYSSVGTNQSKTIGYKLGTTTGIEPILDVTKNPIVIPPESGNKINLQVGISSDESSVISFDAGLEIGYFKLNLTSEKRARESLDKIDSLLSRFTTKISELGAIENRLDSVYQSNEIQSRNLIAAMSSIKDADLAEESSTYIKSKILSDVTASLLTTANQFPSMALSLIQGVQRY